MVNEGHMSTRRPTMATTDAQMTNQPGCQQAVNPGVMNNAG